MKDIILNFFIIYSLACTIIITILLGLYRSASKDRELAVIRHNQKAKSLDIEQKLSKRLHKDVKREKKRNKKQYAPVPKLQREV